MSDPRPTVSTVPCVICQQSIPYSEATAGSLYADGTQAFACSSHIAERLQWTLEWVMFESSQTT
ncbi:MAG TPA: hypothetical protein VLF43_03055 [Candidatus Saccharimonadales bacterium]|nr:hypothetical protein [Candidatus Saccharimonadales bacterium]